MAHFFTFDMRFEGEGYREEDPPTEEDHEELKKTRESIIKALHEEDIRSDESIPDSDDDEQDFQEIKDPRQDAAATAHAVNKVLEELIQSTASKKICDVHHLDRQILTKVLGNLKDSIAQETLNQLQLPASKKICYAHNDDEKSLKNLITQETSINLHNVSEQGDAGGVDLGSQAEAGGVIMDIVEGVCSTKDDINANDSVDTHTPTSKTLGKRPNESGDYADGGGLSATNKIQKLASMEKLD